MKIFQNNSIVNATVITIILVMISTIATNALDLYGWLGEVMWHHWIAKSIVSLVVWFLIAFIPGQRNLFKSSVYLYIVLISIVIVKLYFTYHYFSIH